MTGVFWPLPLFFGSNLSPLAAPTTFLPHLRSFLIGYLSDWLLCALRLHRPGRGLALLGP